MPLVCGSWPWCGCGRYPRRPARLAVGVDGELLLVPFELRPVDIAVVVILQQNLPVLKRLVVAIGLARPSVDDLGALLTLAVGARIERVLEHGNYIAVADRRPLEGDQFLAVGRPREVDPLGEHRQQEPGVRCRARGTGRRSGEPLPGFGGRDQGPDRSRDARC